MTTTICQPGTYPAIVVPDPLGPNLIVAIRNGVHVEGQLGAGLTAFVDVQPTSGEVTLEVLEPAGAYAECRPPGWTTSTTSTTVTSTVVEDVQPVAQADTLPVTGTDSLVLFGAAAVLALAGLALTSAARRRPGGAR